ncbi:MAG: EFR1 family ferrodoxin [Clostridiales Family XIII bacterium]|nr:EFR1 family ferrodoxin [Clostridiales Family XIII bacterium]
MKNKTIDIYCFSGTGNTYLTAKKIVSILQAHEYVANIKNMTNSEPNKIDLSHTIGIGFPVACWNTFPVVKDFINNLPNSDGTEVFIFTTMGDSSLNTAASFGCILKKKGYNVIGTQGFLMPNNFIAVQKKEKNILKVEKAYRKIEIFVKQLIDGSTKSCKTNLFFKICFAITNFITNRWRGKIFQKIVRFGLEKNKCIKCGLCIKICPVKNIEYDTSNYPIFNGMKCQMCIRCISYCPKHAIKSFLLRKTYKALSIEEMEKWNS